MPFGRYNSLDVISKGKSQSRYLGGVATSAHDLLAMLYRRALRGE